MDSSRGVRPRAEDECLSRIQDIVDQYRYMTLVDSSEVAQGLFFRVEVQGTPERLIASTIQNMKGFLDDQSVVIHEIRGVRLYTTPSGEAVFPYEFVVNCEEASSSGGPSGPPLGLECPGPASDPVAALRALETADPERLSFSRLEIVNNRLEAEGLAADIITVTTLIGEMEGCSRFTAVDLASVRVSSGGYQFSLSSNI